MRLMQNMCEEEVSHFITIQQRGIICAFQSLIKDFSICFVMKCSLTASIYFRNTNTQTGKSTCAYLCLCEFSFEVFALWHGAFRMILSTEKRWPGLFSQPIKFSAALKAIRGADMIGYYWSPPRLHLLILQSSVLVMHSPRFSLFSSLCHIVTLP